MFTKLFRTKKKNRKTDDNFRTLFSQNRAYCTKRQNVRARVLRILAKKKRSIKSPCARRSVLSFFNNAPGHERRFFPPSKSTRARVFSRTLDNRSYHIHPHSEPCKNIFSDTTSSGLKASALLHTYYIRTYVRVEAEWWSRISDGRRRRFIFKTRAVISNRWCVLYESNLRWKDERPANNKRTAVDSCARKNIIPISTRGKYQFFSTKTKKKTDRKNTLHSLHFRRTSAWERIVKVRTSAALSTV